MAHIDDALSDELPGPDDGLPLGGAAEGLGAPQLEVRAADGRLLQQVALGPEPLAVGSHPGNGLVLEGDGVGRFHMRVAWDGDQIALTDLGTRGGTLLDGAPAPPQAPRPWRPGQVVRVGPFVFQLLAPGAAPGDEQAGPAPAAPLEPPPGQIEITLDPAPVRLVPGTPAPVTLTLLNRGSAPDELLLAVSGVPEGWVTLPAAPVRVEPGTQALVVLTVTPPRTAEARARDYPVRVEARASRAPGAAEAHGLWSVEPFEGLELDVRPRKVVARGQASYRVTLHNTGNDRATYRLAARDEGGVLDLNLSQAQVVVEPGESATVRLAAQSLEPPERKLHARHFTVQAGGQAAAAQLVQRRSLPAWAWTLASLALLLALIGLATWILNTEAQAQAQAQTVVVNGTVVEETPTPELDPELVETQRAQQATAFALQTATAVYLEGDDDRDGLINSDELGRGTAPDAQDTDGDALPDAAEVRLGSDPLYYDSDGDGVPDGEEVRAGLNPLAPDTDGDGVPDAVDADPLNPPATPTSEVLAGDGAGGGTGGTGGAGGGTGGTGGTGGSGGGSGAGGGSGGGTGSGTGGTGGTGGGTGGTGGTGGSTGGGTGTAPGTGTTPGADGATPTAQASPTATPTVTPLPNVAPSLSLPGVQRGTEDQSLIIGALSASDPDLRGRRLIVTLSVARGQVGLSASSGLEFLAGAADGAPSISFRATITDTNTALGTLFYRGTTNFFGDDTLSVSANDQGNTGSGGALTTSGSVPITILPVNDPPTLAARIPLSAQEGQAAAITRAALWGQDVDNTPDQLSFVVTTPPARGRLTRNGVNVSSFTQADIDAGLIVYTSNVPVGAKEDSFKFVLSDVPVSPNDRTGEQTFQITITGARPVLAPPAQNVPPFVEGSQPVVLIPDAAITDSDSTNLREIEVAITNIQNTGLEILSATPSGNGVSASYNPADGVMRLSAGAGGASIDAFQTVLRTVAYSNNSNAPNVSAARVVRVVVVDDTGATSTPLQISVTVEAVNDPVTLTRNLPLERLPEGGSLGISRNLLLAEDLDNTPAELVYTVLTAPTAGTLLLNNQPATAFTQANIDAGQLSYSSRANAASADKFDFRVVDPAGSEITQTFKIQISLINDPPSLGTPSFALASLNEDAPAPAGAVGYTVPALLAAAGLSDPDGPSSGVALTGANPAGGTWSYSVDGGATWAPLPTDLADTNALLLAANDNTRLALQPLADFNGTIAGALRFRAWDGEAGATDTRANPTAAGVGAFSTATAVASLPVAPVNDAPTLTGLADITYTEGTPAVALLAGASVGDVDLDALGTYSGAALTISRSGGAGADDRFEALAASALGPLNAGGDLIVQNVTIGRVVTNAGGVLQLVFDAGATRDRVNEAVRAIGYRNAANLGVGTPPITLVVTVDDRNAGPQGSGGLATASGSVTVNLTGVNDAPVLAGLNDATFGEQLVNQAARVIDGDVALSDDTTDFGGGTITVSYSTPSRAEDTLTITNTAAISRSGANLVFGGAPVATISTAAGETGQAGATLVVNLLSGSSRAAVEALLEALAYANSSNRPQPTRSISVTVNDGQRTSAPAGLTITVLAENDPPQLAGLDGPTFAEAVFDVGASALDTVLTLTDPDSLDLANGTIRVAYTAGATSADQLGILTTSNVSRSGDVVFLNGSPVGRVSNSTGERGVNGEGLLITIDSALPPGQVELILEALSYRNTSDTPALTRTVSISVTDGDSAASAPVSATITVNPTDDPPTITPIDDQVISEDGATPALAFTIADVDTAVGSLTLSAASSNTALVTTAGVAFGGTGASRTVTVTPLANANGAATVTVRVADATTTVGEPFILTVTPVNDPPTITAIADRTINEDASTPALAFTIGDIDTPIASLTVSATSSNTALVPELPANIALGGTGTARTVTVTPLPNQSGAATITVRVGDGALSASEPFVLTVTPVDDPPTITPSVIPSLGNVTINEGTSTAPLNFTIDDIDTAVGSLTLASTSSNTALVPQTAANITFGGTGASRTVTVTPSPDGFGTATITVRVSDATSTATASFVVTVTNVNDPPTISAIANQTIDEDTNTGAIAFTIGDIDTAVGSLILTSTSSNLTLVPQTSANITLGGTGTSRTVRVTPAANQSGTATITIQVSDGVAPPGGGPPPLVSETFVVTVNAVDDPPTITAIANQAILEDTSTNLLSFTIGDIDTPVASLIVTRGSSSTALVPVANIALGGADANRTVQVTPAANAVGTATISVLVNDGTTTTTETFTVTVTNVNDPPTNILLSNATVASGASGTVVGTLSTVDVDASDTFTYDLAGGTLDNNRFRIAGAAGNRLDIGPSNLAAGTYQVQVDVTDSGGATFVRIFTITVN